MTTLTDPITALDLDRFFSLGSNRYDLLAGTAHNPAGSRVIYLSSDVVKGVHQALVDETGPAWRIILKNCGSLWGKRVAAHLDRELNLIFNTVAADLPIQDYLRFVERYFSAHGWGLLALDMSRAESHGVIAATLENSLFSEVLDGETQRVDYLVSGMLRSLFSHVAGTELDCEEIASTRCGAACGRFVITAPERLDQIEARIERGESADQIFAAICS